MFELNCGNMIRVKTGVGITRRVETGENVSQGSISGGLISALNLDFSVTRDFQNSKEEISYQSVALSPLIYQDDLSRCTTSVAGAQDGNNRIEKSIGPKLLDFNTDKSCYILTGSKNGKNNLKSDLQLNPLTLYGVKINQKQSEKYLGDLIHEDGPAESAHATVLERTRKMFSKLGEAKIIVEDCRSLVVGGVTSGLDIWEMALLPSLISNCESWTPLSEKTLKILEEVQYSMFRKLLGVPKSCPAQSLVWEFGAKLIKYRIIERKLNFLHHLLNLSQDSLAKQILNVQIANDTPGLVQECKKEIKKLGLPNIFDNNYSAKQWKSTVKKAVSKANENEIRTKLSTYRKFRYSDMIGEKFGMKPYLRNLNLQDIRIKFRYRTKMLKHVKMNFSSDPIYVKACWRCECGQIDTNEHILRCLKYEELREDKNLNDDNDLCDYLTKVTLIRSKKNKQ